MEGLDPQGFAKEFEFYGRIRCVYCPVREAMRLRDKVQRIKQQRRKIEEEMKGEEPSLNTIEMYEYLKRSDVVRDDKMLSVELRFYEEVAGAKGKSCEVRNRFKCPFGEESEQLVENGKAIKSLWKYVEWYNSHWNRSGSVTPGSSDMKWYHYDEPGIIDVTSYDDILRALEDGRLKRITKEYERYEKETESQA